MRRTCADCCSYADGHGQEPDRRRSHRRPGVQSPEPGNSGSGGLGGRGTGLGSDSDRHLRARRHARAVPHLPARLARPPSLIAGKLLLQPLIVWILATLVFDLEPLWTSVAVLMAGLPTGNQRLPVRGAVRPWRRDLRNRGRRVDGPVGRDAVDTHPAADGRVNP